MDYPTYLKHYGVLGMHWGIRKDKGISKGRKRKPSEDYIQTKELRKKRMYELSNTELKALNERKNLEAQYRNLNKTKVDLGKKFAADILKEIGKEMAKAGLKTKLKNGF